MSARWDDVSVTSDSIGTSASRCITRATMVFESATPETWNEVRSGATGVVAGVVVAVEVSVLATAGSADGGACIDSVDTHEPAGSTFERSPSSWSHATRADDAAWNAV